MKFTMRIFKGLGLFAAILVLMSFQPKTNSKLPSINLKDLNGRVVNLADYGKDGKITVISFWATWCSPCKKELNNINEFIEEWEEDYNMKLVAVSIDNSRNAVKVKPYVEGKRWDFDVLLDVNGDTQRALNFATVPYLLVVDANGEIVSKHSGYVEGDEYELEDELKELAKH